MALFKITVKTTRIINAIRLEKGMSVEVVSTASNPISSNGGREVVEAFERKYGIDLKKACAVSSTYLEVEKM